MKLVTATFRLIAIVMIATGAALLFVAWYVEEKTGRLPAVKLEAVRFWRHA